MQYLQENWEDLANAIILSAVEDYISAYKRLLRRPTNKSATMIFWIDRLPGNILNACDDFMIIVLKGYSLEH